MGSRLADYVRILAAAEDGDRPLVDVFVELFGSLDVRIAGIEGVASSVAEFQAALSDQAAQIVEAAVGPVRAELQRRADLGAVLTAASVTVLDVGAGLRTLTIEPEAARAMFAPAHMLVLVATDDPSVAMYARRVSYDAATGVLVVEALSSVGAGSYASWTISPGSLAGLAAQVTMAAAGALDAPNVQAAMDQIAAALAQKQPLSATLSALAALPSTGLTLYGTNALGEVKQFDVSDVVKELFRLTTYDAIRRAILAAPLASPALTGTPTAPTAAAGTNTTQVATTEFVTGGLANKANASNTHTINDLSTTGLTAYARSLMDDADAATARSTLGFVGLNVDASGNYGFGSVAVPNYRIVVDLAQNDTTTTGSQISGKVTLTADGTAVSTGLAGIGVIDQSTFNNNSANYSARGGLFQGYANGVSGTVDTVCGVYAAAGSAGAGTVTHASAFVASPINTGGGVVDTFYGFQVPATTLANKVRAFRSSIASGTDRWNFYANGTASNAFAGASRFGSTTAPVNTVDITGSFGRGAPVTKTANFTLAATENWIICNGTGSITVTLPAASSWTGREVTIKTIAAQTVVSAASDVAPLAGGGAGTAILAATAGKWATLVSNGTNWVIMAGN